MIRLGPWALGRKNTKVKCHFYQVVSRARSIDLTYLVGVDLNHLTGRVFVRFHRKSYFFPSLSMLSSLEGSHYVKPTLKEEEVMPYSLESWNIYTIDMRFFCFGDLSVLSIYLFNQLLISQWAHGYLFYILDYNPILLYFVAQIALVLINGNFSRWILCPFDKPPFIVKLFFFFSRGALP